MLFLVGIASAQTPKKKTDYEDYLKRASEAIDMFDKEDFYKKFNFKHKVTEEVKKFSDFTPFERAIFYILQAERFSKHLEYIEDTWLHEMLNISKLNIEQSDQETARKDDIEKYVKELHQIRKKTAVKYENLLEKVFKDFPSDFTEKEKTFMKKTIKDYNDKNKLIQR